MTQFDELIDDSKSPTTPQFDQLTDDSEKYGTVTQQIKAGLEGAAQGIAGPLATAAETKLFDVKPEDIRGRAEANPVTHGIGEAAGLVGGSLIPGVGEYTLGSKLVEAGGAVAKLVSNPVAQAALRGATEMALMSAGDETSKWLQHDPDQSIQSAIAHTGISALLGGVSGGVFSKAGSAIKSLINPKEEGAAESFVKGFKLNLNPLKANEPLFQDVLEPIKPNIASEKVGSSIGQAIKDHASQAGLEGLGASIGAAAGHATGIPGAGWIGAYLGKEHLSPLIKSIIPTIGSKLVDMDINPQALISSVNMAEAAIKGRLLVEKAASSIFNGSDFSDGNKADTKFLDTQITALNNNPELASKALDNQLGHYTPNHAVALGSTTGRVIQYLNSIKPSTEKQAPLDPLPRSNPIADAQYENALTVAEKPLSVFNSIKQGNITSKDIQHLSSMYPDLYDQMKSSAMSSLIDHVSKNKEVPYQTRLGLSLFMGQPLDSSMSPASIQASQPAIQQPQQSTMSSTKANKLGAIASMDATNLQSQQLKQAKRNKM